MPTPRKPARKPAARTTAKPAVRKPAPKAATPKRATTAKPAAKTAARTPARPAAKTERELLPVAKISQPAKKPVVNTQSIIQLAKKVRADLGDTQVNVLQVPYEARQLASHFGAKWHKELRCHIYPGPVLPAELAFYASEPYSWERYIEDQINGQIKPVPGVPKPMVPRQHQQAAIDKIRSIGARGGRGFIEADQTGLGKGLAGSTKIPTPNGFSTMEEIQVGDLVFSSDGSTTQVLAKYTSQAKKFYRITFSDGSTVDADEDHRWLTSSFIERQRKRNNTKELKRLSANSFENLQTALQVAASNQLAVSFLYCFDASNRENANFIRTTLKALNPVGKLGKQWLYHPQEVMEQALKELPHTNKWGSGSEQASVKNTGEIYSTQIAHIDKEGKERKNHSIPLARPIQGNYKALPIDPYTLGAWLGDGGAHHGIITSMDGEIVERVAKSYSLQKAWPNSGQNKSFNYRFNGLNAALRKMYGTTGKAVKLTKIIPNDYLTASFEQRVELLKGLLDTDGSIGRNDTEAHGGVTFAQKDKTLFFQVYALICSLGWKATWRARAIDYAFGQHKEFGIYYELLFYPDHQVFSLSRKADLLNSRLSNFASNFKNKLRYIVRVTEIEKTEDYYCISVDAPNHIYLCTESYIPTHNTLSSLLGVAAVASLRGHARKNPAKLLIMCPKSVIPHWRNTIRASGVDNLRVAIINYDQALKLITQPEVAQKAKTQRTAHTRQINNGIPNVKWDLVILDESHRLKNDSNRSKTADVITRAGAAAADAPFVVYASATIGQTPLELRYLASLVAQLTGRKTLTGKTWGAWLEAQGFAVKKSKSGEYSWISQRSNTGEAEADRVAGLQQRDTQRMAELLFSPDAPSIRRSPSDIAGWPEIQRIPYPVELPTMGMSLYKRLWETFRSELRLLPRGHNPKAGVVVQLRFRQKASLLLIDDTFEQIEDLLENGYQVAVSAQFIESVDQLRAKLSKAGVASEEFSGRQGSAEREAARLRFQRGEVPVIFFTVTEGISLHAGEQLPDGSHASTTPRATIVHDIRYSSLEMLQIEGRAHRDGQAANIYYMVAEGTVQEPILALMLRRMNNLQRMSGDLQVDSDEAAMVEQILERGT